jgi:hypothetical protein
MLEGFFDFTTERGAIAVTMLITLGVVSLYHLLTYRYNPEID